MQVPFVDLSRIVKKVKPDVMRDWEECLDHCAFVGGPSVPKLEKKLEGFLNVGNFVTCGSGTDALIIALRAMGLGAGMRVAVPNMTFWAPYEAIVQMGAEPVLIDIDPDDLQLDFEEFKEAHDRFHLDGAILVHLFGWTSQKLYEFRQFCRKHDIVLIEDGAQAFGVELEGESVLSGAQLGTMSFYPAKVLGASGDAGGITTQDIKLAEKIRALCNHGRAGHYTYDFVGFNSRLGALQARFLMRVLDEMTGVLEERRAAEAFYQKFFSDYPDLCRVYQAPAGVTSNGYLNVLRVYGKSGDELVSGLVKEGIGAARTYPQTLDMQPPAKKALKSSDLRHSIEFSKNVINLPLFSGITIEECEIAAKALLKIMKA